MTSISMKSERKDGFRDARSKGRSSGSLSDSASASDSRNSSLSSRSSSSVSTVDTKAKESLVGWPLPKPPPPVSAKTQEEMKLKKLGSKVSEIEMMKERFAKLLLGEDMSGSGRGVCPALALSNAITNLCAAIFGQLWRLEPLPSEKKFMWQRDMEVLLSVSDHIVELIPSIQTFPDGTKHEVMTSRPRSDLNIHLPALRKLDNILLEILDSFEETEFWYIDQGLITPEVDGSASFRRSAQRQEEKWWLPVPRVCPEGLKEDTRKKLVHRRECATQILKAAMAINSISLADMEVPESYIENLPKNGRTCLGDIIYRYISSDQFSSECLLDCLDLSSEHFALEIANRVEASIYVWHKRLHSKAQLNPSRSTAKSSWEMVKELMIDGDKRDVLAERAENLLVCLKQRFPGLSQTTLDASKIQCNKDVGKSILESYSRVLESLSFNIVARIDDVLYVDDLTRQSDSISSAPTLGLISQKKVRVPYSKSISGTPYKTSLSTPNFSPAPPLTSPRKGERTPFLSCNNSKQARRGLGVKRVLTNYLAGEVRVKNCSNLFEGLGSAAMKSNEVVPSQSSLEVAERHKELSSWK